MTIEDFSSGFDTLLNSYAASARFGSTDNSASIELDEYEKSLFLTSAQEEEVLSLYNGRNSSLQSFEETEELRRYLSDIVVDAQLDPLTNLSGNPLSISSKSTFFSLPDGNDENIPAVWFIVYESVNVSSNKCGSADTLEVVPVRHDEYHRIKKNPFRGANDRRALRLDLADNIVEIVCNYTVTKYYLRYLKRPEPIILVDLEGDGINGYTNAETCKLHESLHQRILERAVEKALQSRGYTKVNNENR